MGTSLLGHMGVRAGRNSVMTQSQGNGRILRSNQTTVSFTDFFTCHGDEASDGRPGGRAPLRRPVVGNFTLAVGFFGFRCPHLEDFIGKMMKRI